ncbi:hypothetical protein ACX80E_07710 [Arthrobacter sp. TMN-49]
MSLPLAAAAGIAVLILSGCSGQAGLKALDRAATPEDKMPAIVSLPEGVNSDSIRLLTTKDGVRYFAAQSDDARTACVAVVPTDVAGSHVGCGNGAGSGEIVTVSGMSGAFTTRLLADGSDTGKLESGWTKVTDNILVIDR